MRLLGYSEHIPPFGRCGDAPRLSHSTPFRMTDLGPLVHVLLVDDHALFREGMELVLQRLDPAVCVSHAGHVDLGVARLRDAPAPNLVLADLHMPGMRGIDALLRLREANDEVPVVVLAGSEDAQLVRQAIDSGAMGYIPKSTDSREVARALALILRGGVYLPAVALSTGPTAAWPQRQPVHLTPRQREVLLRLVQGKANKVIARELGISDTTVKSHVTALLQALDVSNRTQAVYAVARLGMHLGPEADLTAQS